MAYQDERVVRLLEFYRALSLETSRTNEMWELQMATAREIAKELGVTPLQRFVDSSIKAAG